MNGESVRGQQPANPPNTRGESPTKKEILASLAERLDVLGAVDAALNRRAEVMSIVERSTNPEVARSAVMKLLGISEVGANAVLAMQVRRFCADERAKIADEVAALREDHRRLVD